MRAGAWGLLGAACLGFVGETLTPARADACMNEVLRVESPVEDIAKAEKALDEGKLGEAASRVRVRYPSIRELGPEAPPLALRAERIYALALVRADGRLDGQLGWARWGNLEWAVETLRALDAKKSGTKSDLAEAYVRFSRSRQAGLDILEDLDRRDLLGSAFAYVALARGRAASHDTKGAEAAMRRCAMTTLDLRRCTSDGEVVVDARQAEAVADERY